MKNLIAQMLKFGVVGGISFVVDFTVYGVLCNVIGVHYLVAGMFGFTISVIVNYLLSMRVVFESRDDMSRTGEFVIFVILSLIGLGLNSLILYICVDVIYANWAWLNGFVGIKLMNLGAKVVATGIVMVYNFVTRKIFIEKKA